MAFSLGPEYKSSFKLSNQKPLKSNEHSLVPNFVASLETNIERPMSLTA